MIDNIGAGKLNTAKLIKEFSLVGQLQYVAIALGICVLLYPSEITLFKSCPPPRSKLKKQRKTNFRCTLYQTHLCLKIKRKRAANVFEFEFVFATQDRPLNRLSFCNKTYTPIKAQ